MTRLQSYAIILFLPPLAGVFATGVLSMVIPPSWREWWGYVILAGAVIGFICGSWSLLSLWWKCRN